MVGLGIVIAFLFHIGRMSCLQAGGAVRCEARHRAQISRFLARPRWRKLDINSMLRQHLLDRDDRESALALAGDIARAQIFDGLDIYRAAEPGFQPASSNSFLACVGS